MSESNKKSLQQINRELEEILRRLEKVNKIKDADTLNAYFEQVSDLQKAAIKPNKDTESFRKSEELRTFKNLDSLYKAIIMRAQHIEGAEKVKKDTAKLRNEYRKKIDRRRLDMLDAFISSEKGYGGEEELVELKQKELVRKQGYRESLQKTKAETDDFLELIDENEIDRYQRSNEIINLITAIDSARQEIEKANNRNQDILRQIEEISNNTSLSQTDKDAQINPLIAEQTTKNEYIETNQNTIKENAKKLQDIGISDARYIVDKKGKIDNGQIDVITNRELERAKQDKEVAENAIAVNIMANRAKIVSSRKLPNLTGNSVDTIKVQMEKIVGDLINQQRKSSLLRSDIDQVDKEIDKIEDRIKSLEKELGKGSGDSKGNGKLSEVRRYKKPREYRAEGVELDAEYVNKNMFGRYLERFKFIRDDMPKNTWYKWIVAAVRSFSPRAGYEISISRKKNEAYYRRAQAVLDFAENIAVNEGIDPQKAIMKAQREIGTSAISGKEKVDFRE